MIDPRLEEYIENHTTPEPELLYELRRNTFLHTPYPRMLSGPVQGQFLGMVSRMIRPERILEIGTFTGYSAICLAGGLGPGGILHTIEADPSHAEIARGYFRKAKLEDRIILHDGDALEVIPRLNETFDLVFIDADKENYEHYYEKCLELVRPGGLIMLDNMFMHGAVVAPNQDDRGARTIDALNHVIQNDSRVEMSLLPIADGVTLVRKK